MFSESKFISQIKTTDSIVNLSFVWVPSKEKRAQYVITFVETIM